MGSEEAQLPENVKCGTNVLYSAAQAKGFRILLLCAASLKCGIPNAFSNAKATYNAFAKDLC